MPGTYTFLVVFVPGAIISTAASNYKSFHTKLPNNTSVIFLEAINGTLQKHINIGNNDN